VEKGKLELKSKRRAPEKNKKKMGLEKKKKKNNNGRIQGEKKENFGGNCEKTKGGTCKTRSCRKKKRNTRTKRLRTKTRLQRGASKGNVKRKKKTGPKTEGRGSPRNPSTRTETKSGALKKKCGERERKKAVEKKKKKKKKHRPARSSRKISMRE